jgi:hypothetical protein
MTVIPIPYRQQFEAHEVSLTALGVGTALAVAIRNRLGFVSIEMIGALILYISIIWVSSGRMDLLSQRVRLFSSFVFVLWFYCAIARITPALGTALRDRSLLAIDQGLFGKTPAIFCERVAAPWLTDFLSLCYLTYHLYLAMAVLHALQNFNAATWRLSVYLFTGFAVGFAGYLLVPAVGPASAYPNLFVAPLPEGILGRLIGALVAKGSSGYDVFPSLHILITCILLDHDWRHVRRRFWVMIGPSFGLVTSTIYLRYHYGIDLIAGFVVFLALRQTFLKAGAKEIGWRR